MCSKTLSFFEERRDLLEVGQAGPEEGPAGVVDAAALGLPLPCGLPDVDVLALQEALRAVQNRQDGGPLRRPTGAAPEDRDGRGALDGEAVEEVEDELEGRPLRVGLGAHEALGEVLWTTASSGATG